ncbi:hypothetical protein ACR3K2_29010 [Cryptosporidium serpentis]
MNYSTENTLDAEFPKNSDIPFELVTLIEAIFYYIGGFLISVKGTTQNEILILKILLDENCKDDNGVTLKTIEMRLNAIQGIDPLLKIMLAKVFPKSLMYIINQESQLCLSHVEGYNKSVVYMTLDDLLDSLIEECGLIELE